MSVDIYNIYIFTTHRRPLTAQSLTLIRHRGWSGRIASLPLFSESLPAGAAKQQPAGIVFYPAAKNQHFASWRKKNYGVETKASPQR